MIAVVTDSSSQIPDELAVRHGVTVVPIPVIVDDVAYEEGVDIDADRFYSFFANGIVPSVSTSQPSPGRMAETYSLLAERGVTGILSVHVAESLSGTLNSARLAADGVDVPVRLVDSRTTSFGVSCCVIEAAEAVAMGADLETAARSAETTAARVRSVFILQALDFALKGGRAAGRGMRFADDVPVLSTDGPDISHVGSGRAVDELCDLMAAQIHNDGEAIRVALGTADSATEVFTQGLVDRIAGRDDVVELLHYRVGPSVGAYTGPGTAGGFWCPVERR